MDQLDDEVIEGVLSVIKTSDSEERIRRKLSFLSTHLGTITVMQTKGRTTSNCVSVMTTRLYKQIEEKNIYEIKPYIINDNHIPSGTQTKDIFMSFEYTNRRPASENAIVNYLVSIIDELIRFKLISKEEISYSLEIIPRSDEKSIGFLHFSDSTPLHACVYIRSILNGNITTLSPGKNITEMKISAFWSSTNK